MHEEMEMPCLCDCGEWFDLNDGYPSTKRQVVICPECSRKECYLKEKISDLESEIFALEQLPNKKREISKLRKQIIQLENE